MRIGQVGYWSGVSAAVATIACVVAQLLRVEGLLRFRLDEILKVLGIPEGTLKARLHRGRELLKRRLVSGKATPTLELASRSQGGARARD